MKYFELFEMTVQLKPDKNLVRKKYLDLSRKYHPDYFVNKEDADQHKVLEEAAILNKAFKTFNSPDETIRYVLKEKNLMEDDEKYPLLAEFLMQMMEINEEFAEAAFSDDNNIKQKLQEQLTKIEKSIYEPVAAIIENYEEDITTEEELLKVKDYYFKKKYLLRLREQIK